MGNTATGRRAVNRIEVTGMSGNKLIIFVEHIFGYVKGSEFNQAKGTEEEVTHIFSAFGSVFPVFETFEHVDKLIEEAINDSNL